MSAPRYLWRKLTPQQKQELLTWRKRHSRPWHSPPHRPHHNRRHLLISAACYEHAHHIGFSPQRMDSFTSDLLRTLSDQTTAVPAWCVLPNHYHTLVATPDLGHLLHQLGLFHGRTAHQWNGEENTRGRKVFYRAAERFMRSERHYLATLNYIHNNPVHHRYCRLWTDWPWTSATEYLDQVGRREAERIWKEYPIQEYGQKWDQPDL